MYKILYLFISIVDPFHVLRHFIIYPIWKLARQYYAATLRRTKEEVLTARDILFKHIILLLAALVIVCTAIFMYVGFYYVYMPVLAHSRVAHMQFTPCDNGKDLCSFPRAHVPLTKKQQLLVVGQPYRVIVIVEMPESPVNQNLGMLMVCAEMRGTKGDLIDHSCRTGILQYKSNLVNWISTWIKAPLYILGLSKELQKVEFELFTSYHDDDRVPVHDVYVEIQSKQIQFYSVSLLITAHFTGLRYLMYNWPVLSATVGISSNLYIILLICLLSWYHAAYDKDWFEGAKLKFAEIKKQVFELSSDYDSVLEDNLGSDMELASNKSFDISTDQNNCSVHQSFNESL